MVKTPAPQKNIHKVKKTKSHKGVSPSKSPTQNSPRKNENAKPPKKSKKKISSSESSCSDSDSTQNSRHTVCPKEVITQANTNQESITTPNDYPSDLTTSNVTHHTLQPQQYNHMLQQQNYNDYVLQNHPQNYEWPQRAHFYDYRQHPQNNYHYGQLPQHANSYGYWPPQPYNYRNNYRNNPEIQNTPKPPPKPKTSEEALSFLDTIMEKQSEKQKIEAPDLSQDEFALKQTHMFGEIYVDPNTDITYVKMCRTPLFFTVAEEQRMRNYYQTDLLNHHANTHDYANPCRRKVFRCPTAICNYRIINSENTEYHVIQHAKQFHTQNKLTYVIRYNNEDQYFEYNPDDYYQEETNLPNTCDNQNT